MSSRLILVCMFLYPLIASTSENREALTSKEIYTKYSHAIVKVITPTSFGTGFIVSSKGIVITAAHVVAQTDQLDAYATDIKIRLYDGRELKATPITSAPSKRSKTHDYAILQTEPLKVPVLQLGTWKEIAPGDQMTTMGFPFDPPTPLLLSVMASVALLATEKAPNDSIVFQGPNNKGLSGAPLISNLDGKVVGIVNNRIVGITEGLKNNRDIINNHYKTNPGSSVTMFGYDPLQSTLDLINVLDQSLISGMGVAIAIDYAKDAAASSMAD